MVTGWVHWIVNLSNCNSARNIGLQEDTINISKPQGKTTNWENEMGYHRKRETDGQKERERGREGAVLNEKGG